MQFTAGSIQPVGATYVLSLCIRHRYSILVYNARSIERERRRGRRKDEAHVSSVALLIPDFFVIDVEIAVVDSDRASEQASHELNEYPFSTDKIGNEFCIPTPIQRKERRERENARGRERRKNKASQRKTADIARAYRAGITQQRSSTADNERRRGQR